MISLPERDDLARRMRRLLAGLLMCGVGIALMVRAELGLSPWDVLHQGISERTGIPLGTVAILVGFVVLLGWIPLRQRLGLGTVVNLVVVGLTIDLTMLVVDTPSHAAGKWAYLLGGVFLIGPGSGWYIGAGLGPGPRDGLMTGIAARGRSVRVVRTAIELSALRFGWLLGGTVGVGTVLFALTIGPNVHYFLDRLTFTPTSVS